MPIIKCKLCQSDIEVQTGETIVACPRCGGRQPVGVLDREAANTLLAQGYEALKNQGWVAAKKCFGDVLVQEPENPEANLGKLLASEQCANLKEFIQSRKTAYASPLEKTMPWKPAQDMSDHIAQAVQKNTLPGYVDPETIRNLYDFTGTYTVQESGWRLIIQQEEIYWSSQLQLVLAMEHGSEKLVQELQTQRNQLFTWLEQQLAQSRRYTDAQKRELEKKYKAHIAEADRRAEALRIQGLAQLNADYQKWEGVVSQEAEEARLQQALQFFSAHSHYRKAQELAKQCQSQLGQLQESRKRKKRVRRLKQMAVLALILAVGALLGVLLLKPALHYSATIELLESGAYLESREAFLRMEDYRDSESYAQYALASYFLDCARKGDESGWELLFDEGYSRSKQSLEVMNEESVHCELLVQLLREVEPQDVNEAIQAITSRDLTSDREVALLAYQIYNAKDPEKTDNIAVTRYSHEEQVVLSYLDAAKSIFRSLDPFLDSQTLAQECVVLQAATMIETGVIEHAKQLEAYKLLCSVADHPLAKTYLDAFQQLPITVQTSYDTTYLSYDANGRLICESIQDYYVRYDGYTIYTYDANGCRIRQEWIAESGYALKNASDYVETTEYDDRGQPVSAARVQANGSGYVREYTYEKTDGGTQQTETSYRKYNMQKNNRQLEDTITRTYDADGKLLQEQRKSNMTASNSYTHTYTYNNLDQVVESVRKDRWGSIKTYRYHYNVTGGLDSVACYKAGAKEVSETTTYLYNYIYVPGAKSK